MFIEAISKRSLAIIMEILAVFLILVVPMISISSQLSAQASVFHNRVIHVHRKGNDNESCLTGNEIGEQRSNKCCKTLEYVADKLLDSRARNMTIILETAIQVRRSIKFSNHALLTFQGRGEGTRLSCNCKKFDSIGVSFIHIKALKLTHSSIIQCCGVITANNLNYTASVLMQDCSDVTIENFQIRDNVYSSGLLLLNPSGEISVRKCKFSRNGAGRSSDTSSLTGAGLHIELFQDAPAMVTIAIYNCECARNKFPGIYQNPDNPALPLDATKKREWKRETIGGGMAIVLQTGSNITRLINITNCTFVDNHAEWGGGLCIYVQKKAHNNKITVSNSKFLKNTAYWGGGGLQVRLEQLNEKSQNYIHLEGVTFENNRAFFGGGTSVSALPLSYVSKAGEILQFINCTWYNNSGNISPAVDLSPHRFQQLKQGYSINPLFKDIKILTNHMKITKGDGHIVQGVFVVRRFTVQFQGTIEFEDNSYSALYLTSGRAIFVNSSAHFYRNQGISGGAITIRGFSALVVNDSSNFTFINNSAARVGGGIYYAPIDQRQYFSGQICFLEYGGVENDLHRRNITFRFNGNHAPLGGTSIYSESIYSCYYAYFEDNGAQVNLTAFLNRIGYFYLDTGSTQIQLNLSTPTALATAPRNVWFNGTPPLKTTPGKLLHLPLVTYDEFNTNVQSEIGLRVENNDQVSLDNHFTSNKYTRVYGAPSQNATLVLSTPQELCNIDYRVDVLLLSCPPGFFYDQGRRQCLCSADDQSQSYPAITKCDYAQFNAFVKSGYWVGYYPSHIQNESTLYTAFYPLISATQNTLSTGLLQVTADSENLSAFMCGNSKEGALCGKCRSGHSAYYHSNRITCGKNQLCHYGLLFYVLSDIVPTGIFFTIAITSGISFSSGAMNGFVFFSQVVDVFSQDLIFSNSYNEAKVVGLFQAGAQLIYGIFNINFFAVFPFCFWEGATIMDALAFKYVTTMFVMVLIAVIVIAMKFVSMNTQGSLKYCHKAKALISWRKDSAVIHGISTFLIICYGQYTRVSFFILTMTYLQGKPGVKSIPVTFYGGLPYLSNAHLVYAIPAIICTTFLVILPPLLLLLYPLVPYLLSWCGLNEHPVVNKLLELMCINRLIPLFDSFQSCYKDKMRFYAGLYFLYRMAAFLAHTHSEQLPPVFVAVLILGIHSVLHPYNSWKHNALDALIFLDIAIISTMSEMIRTSLITESDYSILHLKIVQLAFIYLPLITLIFVILVKVGRKLNLVCRLSAQAKESLELSISVNRAQDDETEMASQSKQEQLQVPLLIM